MSLFIKKIIERNVNVQPIPPVHLEILQNWQGMIERKELHKQKETAVSISFVSKFLETVLGYQTIGSGKRYSLAQEYPIAKGAVDTALGEFFNDKQGDTVHAVFELKGAKAKNLDNLISGRNETPVQQGWRYARDAKGCQWILVTNYLEIRLYAFGETTLVYESFNLAKLTDPTEYAKFILCLHADNLLTGNTKTLLAQSNQAEKDITAQLYDDYKRLREELINGLMEDNPTIAPLEIVPITQKLLDRILFIAFAEDNGLLPDASIKQAVEHIDLYESKPIYQNLKGLFNAVNKGRAPLKIPAYNGGLFAPDKQLDKLILSDTLCQGFLKIAEYDFYDEISVTVLGHIFEQSIADLEEITAQIQEGGTLKTLAKTTAVSGKRKRHGIVYTPDHITAFIVEHTLGEHLKHRFADCLTPFGSLQNEGDIQWNKPKDSELKFWYEWQSTLKTIKIVDAACGSGAFLVAAFDVLHFEYQKVNARIAEITGHPSVFDLNKEILNSNLFGVDLNSESIEITKLSLWLKTAQRGKKLENIDNCLQVGNSLGFENSVIEGGFCWQTNFSKIMQNGGFDVVLGNPPYVRQELFSDSKPFLQQNYAVYHGVSDLYAYFFELGFKLLKPNGMLGFISSATFFKTGSGEPLRRYLKDNATLQKVVDFGDLQVFEGVTTYPAILIFQNAKPVDDSQIQMLALTNELPEKLSEYFALNHGIMAHSQLKNDSWQFEYARLSQLRDKLTNGFPTLKAVYGSPLYGIKTGLNEAFVIDGETKKRLISQDPNSAELLKPFLEGKDLKKWHAQPRDLWIILMRRGTDIEKYPAIKAHLENYKNGLIARSSTGHNWFEISSVIAYHEKFNAPKLIWADISKSNQLSFDSKGFHLADTCFFLPSSDAFVFGLLNSSIQEYIFKALSPIARGGFYRYKTQYVETLPIPPATPEQKTKIGELAQRCQTLTEQRYVLENKIRRRLPDLGVVKVNQKLERWWRLDFKAFQDELKKTYKSEIPVKERGDWQEMLEDAKTERETLDLQIRLLEKELNLLVYGLFGLSDEEIGMIEGEK